MGQAKVQRGRNNEFRIMNGEVYSATAPFIVLKVSS
jgi:hypothetical protein